MKSSTSFRIAFVVALGATLLACAKQESRNQASMEAASPAAAAAPVADTAAEAAGGGLARTRSEAPDETQLTSSAATYTDAQRKFIRTAQANFRVQDVYQAALAIEDAVAAQGGFVTGNEIAADVQNTTRQSIGGGKLVELAEYTVRGELTVRVPSDKTQPFLRSIAKYMEFLDRRNFAAADAQFELLRQQLAYQRNQEAQQELGQAKDEGGKLGQKATVISARNEAKSSRDEALIAQKEFEDRVEFATLNLSLYQLPKLRRTEMTDMEAAVRDSGPGFFSRLGDSLSAGWFGLLEVVLVLIHLWPLWLALTLGWLALRALRRKRA
ncbi:DUF4349 domain-containing protein [Pseudoxanthomonas sp. CF125]|uniref:DUF4349 domain-containing protein n=1 Tax=Pseudoxanthomonas sp. CF125 TaxID=1855303 RepID=UPI00088C5619|nr:DUF4349 domain-containing protein [Pseudoxanthomonas sp. CF125]SDR15946.1 protein of unknown function [Pseudoxanthomonas sp. CF125]